jgi:hypothetical protein
MRTLDDEADALRKVKEHLLAAQKAMPKSDDTIWIVLDDNFADMIDMMNEHLAEIGATP